MNSFKAILRFEYLNYVKSKAFWVTTGVLIGAILILSMLPVIIPAVSGLFDKGEESNKELKKAAIIDAEGIYPDNYIAAYFPNHEIVRLDSASSAEALIDAGDYDFALEITGTGCKVFQKGTSAMMSSVPGTAAEMVKLRSQQLFLESKGVTETELSEFYTIAPVVEVVSVGKDITQTYWLSYALLMILYMSILLYGQYVMTSVVTEKTSKMMELLITSAKPTHLMFGKVIGTGLAGLTQLGAVLLTAGVSIAVSSESWMSFAPSVYMVLKSAGGSSMLLAAVLFYLLGFFLYAFIYAGFASTVSRLEDAQSVIILPMMLFIVAFLVSMLGMTFVNETWVIVCSYIPFFSPMVMFMRMCLTDVSIVEFLISVAILTASVFLMGILSAKIYRTGVMMYGKAPKLKDIFRYLRES